MKFYAFAIESAPIQLTEEQFFHKLSNEAFIGSNVVEFFGNSISSVIGKLKSYLTVFKKFDSNPYVASIEHNFIKMERNKLETRYINKLGLLVQVPESFKGEFLPYANDLYNIGSTLVETTVKIFSEYDRTLSSVLSDHKQLSSLNDLSSLYTSFNEARSSLTSKLAVYHTNSANSRDKLGRVIPRFADARELVKEIKKLSRFMELSKIKEIESMVKKTTDLLGLLEKQIKEKTATEISPETVKSIATGAYELAKYVDSIVVYHYSCMSLIGCTKVLFEDLIHQ